MKLLNVLCTIAILGTFSLHAEEANHAVSTPAAADESAAVTPDGSEKSFFETRTLEDIQKRVEADAQLFEVGGAISPSLGG